jgi:hypothetical protein
MFFVLFLSACAHVARAGDEPATATTVPQWPDIIIMNHGCDLGGSDKIPELHKLEGLINARLGKQEEHNMDGQSWISGTVTESVHRVIVPVGCVVTLSFQGKNETEGPMIVLYDSADVFFKGTNRYTIAATSNTETDNAYIEYLLSH